VPAELVTQGGSLQVPVAADPVQTGDTAWPSAPAVGWSAASSPTGWKRPEIVRERKKARDCGTLFTA
jgi:hypothetical protein